MRTLTKLVAQTKVGKRVTVKIWRSQKLISKRVLLGRLESSQEFKAENKTLTETTNDIIIEALKISVVFLLPINFTGRLFLLQKNAPAA